MKHFAVLLSVLAAACSRTGNLHDIYGTGGTGGSEEDPNACEHVPPLLGYDPDTTPTGALVPLDVDVGGITASILAPFPVGTTCQEVIVGMRLPIPTAAPQSIMIVTFDSLSSESPMGQSAIHVANLSDAEVLPTKDPYTLEYRFKVKTYHPAYLLPFVGTVAESRFLIATMPECDPARTMRYRPNAFKGWSLLSSEIDGLPLSGTSASLYYGFAECSPD